MKKAAIQIFYKIKKLLSEKTISLLALFVSLLTLCMAINLINRPFVVIDELEFVRDSQYVNPMHFKSTLPVSEQDYSGYIRINLKNAGSAPANSISMNVKVEYFSEELKTAGKNKVKIFKSTNTNFLAQEKDCKISIGLFRTGHELNKTYIGYGDAKLYISINYNNIIAFPFIGKFQTLGEYKFNPKTQKCELVRGRMK